MARVVVTPDNWVPGAPVYYALGLGNHIYEVYNAGAGFRYDSNAIYSLTALSQDALRFEVRPGDTQWFDIGSGKERSEIASTERIEAGTAVHVAYDFSLEAGARNTANWLIVGQFHQELQDGETGRPPPFNFQMFGEQLGAVVRWRDADGNIQTNTIFRDTADIVRGQNYKLEVFLQIDGASNGHLVLVRDGAIIADYRGPLGFSDGELYWQQGLYRQHAPESVAAVYSNLSISSGDMVQFPEAGTATLVLAEAPTLRIETSGMQGSRPLATVAGDAPAGAKVLIYDGHHLIAETTAGFDGGFRVELELGSGNHIFTASVADQSGRLSKLSHEVAAEVGTAAEVVARLNALPAMASLETIVLTDSHTLVVNSLATMKALVANAGPALDRIEGGYDFGFWSGTEGFRTFTTYDKTGTAVEAFTTSVRDGQILRVTHTIYSTDAEIRLEITDYQIKGLDYAWASRAFDKNMKLVAAEYYRADNTLLSSVHAHSDGSVSKLEYDTDGTLYLETITYPDGTSQVKTFAHELVASVASAGGELVAASLSLRQSAPPVATDKHDGDDFYVVKSSADVVHEEIGAGQDTVYTTLHRYEAPANVEIVTFTGTGNTELSGNGLANVLTGGDGADRLDGGPGADKLIGGKGNDTYIVDNTGDVVVEKPGGGLDVIRSSVSYSLPTDVESLILNGGGAIDAAGNGGANTLIGNDAANRLMGLGGDDILTGGRGNDFIDGGEGFDVATFSGRRSDYVVSYSPESGVFAVTDLRGSAFDGADKVANIEAFRFSDGDFSSDKLQVNQAPLLANDSYLGPSAEGRTLTVGKAFGLLANDRDPDGDRLAVTTVNGEAVRTSHVVHGKFGDLQMRADGSFDYRVTSVADQPNGRHAIDHFAYAAFDVLGHTVSASVDIILNRDPTARHDLASFAGSNGTSTIGGNVLANDTDPDGDRLWIVGVVGGDGHLQAPGSTIHGRYGTLLLTADGSYQYAISPDAPTDALARERFVYTVSDGMGSKSGLKAFLDVDLAGRNVVKVTGDVTGSVVEDGTASAHGTLYLSTGGSFRPGAFDGTYGRLVIDENGRWTYVLAEQSVAVQQLKRTDLKTDDFKILSEDGHAGQIISLAVLGSDDRAVVSGSRTVIVSEDASQPVTGRLLVTDPDAGEAGFVASKIAGQHGSFEITTDGVWTYVLDSASASVQSLRGGEFADDVLRLQTLDGTVATLRVLIRGQNDKAVVSGDLTRVLTEGSVPTASGSLKVVDRDAGESSFRAGTVAGQYGSLDIDSTGNWTYRLSHDVSAVRSLGSHASAEDVVTVLTNDGTASKLQFSVHGADYSLNGVDPALEGHLSGHMEGFFVV